MSSNNISPKEVKLTMYSLFVLGALLLMGSSAIIVKNVSFIISSQKAHGVVTDMIKPYNTSGSKHVTSAPVVEFTLKNQRSVTFTSDVSTHPPAYKVGEKVEVYYNPSNPQKAKINSFGDLWFFSFVFACASCLLVGIGVGLKYYLRKL